MINGVGELSSNIKHFLHFLALQMLHGGYLTDILTFTYSAIT